MRTLLTLILLIFSSGIGQAAGSNPLADVAPGLLCRAAIAGAERMQAVPPRLLAAIGRVESGRRDEATGLMHPWPWTVNAEGQGHFYDTKAAAVVAVRELRARGVRSIDVGCMQVNLMHHPDAFPDLDQALDPAANAAYAARFLRQLFGQAGTWPKAVALYHSATPELAEPYARKVLAAWPEEKQPLAPPSLMARGPMMPVQRTLTTAPAAVGGVATGFGLELYRSRPIGLTSAIRRHAR